MKVCAFILGIFSCYIFAKNMGLGRSFIIFIIGAVGVFSVYTGDIIETNASFTSFFRLQFGNLFLNLTSWIINTDFEPTVDGMILLLLMIFFLWAILILGGLYFSSETIFLVIILSIIYSWTNARIKINEKNSNKYYYINTITPTEHSNS